MTHTPARIELALTPTPIMKLERVSRRLGVELYLKRDDLTFWLAGGMLYTLGALVYHRCWLNPASEVFGFHEVSHAFVSAAVAWHYLAIALFVL